jgi:asparagine synthase (glutamine-hydrolysing)
MFDPAGADAEAVRTMTDAIAHRGPDGDGFYTRDAVCLGHRRLKIIDLSDRARQPIADADGRAYVTFNGEIYNYLDLRDTLAARGHRFSTTTDSETIPIAYLEWGDDFLSHLRGMFAFGLYDVGRRRLLLARDRIGIKPLYIARRGSRVAFASEIKAFLAAGLIGKSIDAEAIAEYVRSGFHRGGKSWFAEVTELPPGHFAVIEADGSFLLRPYWTLPAAPSQRGADPSPRLRAALEDAAQRHLQSDVPLGAHLSGGIDSSSVVSLLAKRVDGQLRTFSVYFEEGGWFDERTYIEQVVARYATRHTYTVPTWQAAKDSLRDIVWALDEPIAGPGVIPQYFLNRDIRAQGVVVCNGGQGGDEMFGGYERYVVPYAEAAFFRDGAWSDGFAALARLGPIATLRHAIGDRFAPPGALFLDRELRRSVKIEPEPRDFDAMLRHELSWYLPALLQVEDRTSMASSIESRVPLLDDEVIEIAATTHRYWKLRGGVPKRPLRDAVADLVPAPILARRDKRGLPTPFGRWIRGPLKTYAADLLTDPSFRQSGLFNVDMVMRTFRWHCDGVRDFGHLLWRPITAALWLDLLRSAEPVVQRSAIS